VRQDAADFVVEHPDELPSPRYFEPDEFFNGKAERVLLGQGRDVVGPVEIRDRLQVSLGLNQLLGAPMQQADMGIDARDGFTVQFEHEPQHAVCGGMLGPKLMVKFLRLGDCSGIMLPISAGTLTAIRAKRVHSG
jgi:hypothetical protein